MILLDYLFFYEGSFFYTQGDNESLWSQKRALLRNCNFQSLGSSIHHSALWLYFHIGGNTPVADGNNGNVFSDRVQILEGLVLVFGLIFGLEIIVNLL